MKSAFGRELIFKKLRWNLPAAGDKSSRNTDEICLRQRTNQLMKSAFGREQIYKKLWKYLPAAGWNCGKNLFITYLDIFTDPLHHTDRHIVADLHIVTDRPIVTDRLYRYWSSSWPRQSSNNSYHTFFSPDLIRCGPRGHRLTGLRSPCYHLIWFVIILNYLIRIMND